MFGNETKSCSWLALCTPSSLTSSQGHCTVGLSSFRRTERHNPVFQYKQGFLARSLILKYSGMEQVGSVKEECISSSLRQEETSVRKSMLCSSRADLWLCFFRRKVLWILEISRSVLQFLSEFQARLCCSDHAPAHCAFITLRPCAPVSLTDGEFLSEINVLRIRSTFHCRIPVCVWYAVTVSFIISFNTEWIVYYLKVGNWMQFLFAAMRSSL